MMINWLIHKEKRKEKKRKRREEYWSFENGWFVDSWGHQSNLMITLSLLSLDCSSEDQQTWMFVLSMPIVIPSGVEVLMTDLTFQGQIVDVIEVDVVL